MVTNIDWLIERQQKMRIKHKNRMRCGNGCFVICHSFRQYSRVYLSGTLNESVHRICDEMNKTTAPQSSANVQIGRNIISKPLMRLLRSIVRQLSTFI